MTSGLQSRGVLASICGCLLLLLALASFPLAAQAARIEVLVNETPEHPDLILIKDQFLANEQKGDIGMFANFAGLQKKPALVLLESTGGAIWTALSIGRIIQRHGFSTAVGDNAVCTSACA